MIDCGLCAYCTHNIAYFLMVFGRQTSALDPHTEEEAVKTFVNLAHRENVAVVSVTHRLDTTEPCDKVIVLKDGIVAEEGSPADLVDRQGLYFQMRTTATNKNDFMPAEED